MIIGFDNVVAKDFLNLFAGEKIGRGIAREVYECKVDTSLVIKFETEAHSFQNILEWEAWRAWKEAPKISRWLAPCVDISACGRVLLQKRTTSVTKFPDKIPDFLTDRKRDNYGMYKGKIVCHDYALICVTASERLRKANWW